MSPNPSQREQGIGPDHCQGYITPCPNKGFPQRLRTLYDCEEKNWVVMCDSCFGEADLMVEIQWKELYGK